MVDAVHRIALAEAPHGRGTVGHVQVHPNSRNVIPGQVKFSVDLRNLTQEGLDRMDAALHAQLAALAAQCQCTVEVVQVVSATSSSRMSSSAVSRKLDERLPWWMRKRSGSPL